MKKKILIADDEPAVRRLVTKILANDLIEIVAAQDGAEAVRLTLESKPDLILLDVGMPRLNGWDVLFELRKDPAIRAIPVIMLTGMGSVDAEVYSLDSGADGYLTKPFYADELRARVNNTLHRQPR